MYEYTGIDSDKTKMLTIGNLNFRHDTISLSARKISPLSLRSVERTNTSRLRSSLFAWPIGHAFPLLPESFGFI